MEDLTEWLDGLILVLAAVSILMGIAILILSRRSLSDVLLALFLIIWGVTGGSGRLFEWVDAPLGLQLYSFIVLRLMLMTSLTAFALVYPNLGLTRRRVYGLVAIGGIFVVATVYSLTRPLDADAFDLVVRDLVRPYMAAGYLAGLSLLAVRWLRSAPGDYRDQVAWGLFVFIFWSLHDGLGLIVYGMLHGHDWAQELVFSSPWTLAGAFMWIAGVLLALGLIGVSLRRVAGKRAARDDRYIAFLSAYLLALTTLQVFEPSYPVDGPHSVHVAIDYLVVVFVVYGTLRFNVVDIDLRMKWGVKQGTVAASFVAVYFIVSESTQWIVERQFPEGGAVQPTLVGIVAAGLLLFALTPLQRLGERLADRAVPLEDGEGFRVYRRMQIYRTALQGVLQDGHLNPSEAGALRALRAELGISDVDHAMLEKEVRLDFGDRVPSPRPDA